MTAIYTIGYAKHTPESLFERLKGAGVQTLIDVRELPISRKRGFAKSALSSAAAASGIEYRHIKSLGVPSEMRHRRRDGGMAGADYMAEFRTLLQDRTETLQEAINLAEAKTSCLLCFEEKPEDCHRTVVAEEMAKLAAFVVIHL
jgi:uncharacterized protein (DUF488 family)